jgi:hypothetical protein
MGESWCAARASGRDKVHRPGGRTLGLSRVLVPVALAVAAWSGRDACAQAVVLDGAMHHLGEEGQPEWQEFAADRPEGRVLKLFFPSKASDREATLLIRQRDVKLDREVRLNGRAVGRLVLNEADLVLALAVPPGVLKDGENALEIGPAAGIDDVVVGEFMLNPTPREQALRRSALDVRVTDAGSGRGLPCRVTVVDPRGVLMPLAADPSPRLAVRPGVAYTADGRVRLGLRPGRYTVYVTRGFEYGLASREVTVGEGDERAVALAIGREVPTPGLVACDTHVHTFTHSGHGDATLDERLVTLAGEGVELPVATDHNHFTDYSAPARRLGVASEFTPVVGDEVTTRRGHFNVFPFTPADRVPDARIEYWPDLMREVRKAAGGTRAVVVVLNHPRDQHAGFRPFGPERFNAAVGEDRDGVPWNFDAVELINSGAMQSDPMRVVRDWFALWNHGNEVTAVGASDSHDVSRFIVGQGRTYVACRDDEPGRIDRFEACKSLHHGRVLVSLGLLARIAVDDRFGPGDVATGLGDKFRVAVTVLGPSWVRADRVELYANGVMIRDHRIDASADRVTGPGEKARVEWSIPRPRHDVALVAVASGPGVTAPYWPIPRPYQPTSKVWEPRVLGVTNPVKLDADGNGTWNSPRFYAQFVIELSGTEPRTLIKALEPYDEAVATQAAAFCLPEGQTGLGPEFAKALGSAPEHVWRGFAAFERSLRRP